MAKAKKHDEQSSAKVEIHSTYFEPAELSVNAGECVCFENCVQMKHAVAFDDDSIGSSEQLEKGETFEVKFPVAGTFAYHCENHPDMTGTVTVVEVEAEVPEPVIDKKAAEVPPSTVIPAMAAAPAPVASAPVKEWINCKVNIPNTHVGTIECRIPGSTPEAERWDAACVAAAKVRGIALSSSGKPQFGSAPQVEFLE